MDSFHLHLDELERLLSDDDKKRQIRQRILCYAAFIGSNPVVEAVIQNGVGEEYKWPIFRTCNYPLIGEITSFSGPVRHCHLQYEIQAEGLLHFVM